MSLDNTIVNFVVWMNEHPYLIPCAILVRWTPPKKNAKKRKEPWMQARTRRLLEILGLGGDKQAKSI